MLYAALFSLALQSCSVENSSLDDVAATTAAAPEAAPHKVLARRVDSLYQRLSAAQRAAQLIMVASSTAPKLGLPYATAKSLVQDTIAGGVLFLKGTTAEFIGQRKELNALAAKNNGLPPLYSCDCEPTLLHHKWTDLEPVLPAASQKDTAKVAQQTALINAAMKRVGVQLNFAPIADRKANKAIINKRSFGASPDSIVTLAAAFIKATQDAGLGATVKHFPGHGLVKGDSHKQAVYIDGELKELDAFRKLIAESSPTAVMVGHITVRNNPRWGTGGLPASLSPVIVTGLLRKEIGYDGLIITDALNMAAAAEAGDADWKAIAAGNDIALMPTAPRKLHARMVAAMAKGDAMSKQLEASVKRVLRAKIALGVVR